MKECTWSVDDDGIWSTECGQEFVFECDGPKENNFNYCHHCGKTLVIAGCEQCGGEHYGCCVECGKRLCKTCYDRSCQNDDKFWNSCDECTSKH